MRIPVKDTRKGSLDSLFTDICTHLTDFAQLGADLRETGVHTGQAVDHSVHFLCLSLQGEDYHRCGGLDDARVENVAAHIA